MYHWPEYFSLIFGIPFVLSLLFFTSSLKSTSKIKKIEKISKQIQKIESSLPAMPKSPYDVYPSPVRFFGIDIATSKVKKFEVSNDCQRNCYVRLRSDGSAWRVVSYEEKADEPKSALKLPRKRKQKVNQPEQSETNEAITEVASIPLNVDEVVTETLTVLEQCQEESFEVESTVTTQQPSVNNDISPELQEMMLLAACEEEECFA